MDKIQAYLSFIKEIEGLKSAYRSSWTADGVRETTAAHSWRLALLCAVICGNYPEPDFKKVMLISLIHDLGEVYDGDISALLRPDPGEKERGRKKRSKRFFPFCQKRKGSPFIPYGSPMRRGAHPRGGLSKRSIRRKRSYSITKEITPMILTMRLT